MKNWEALVDSAHVDLTAARLADDRDEILGHLKDALACVTRAIDEVEVIDE